MRFCWEMPIYFDKLISLQGGFLPQNWFYISSIT